jgi:hypothetical protein
MTVFGIMLVRSAEWPQLFEIGKLGQRASMPDKAMLSYD